MYGTLFRCHKEGGHGTLDLKDAIALSCNVYFYNVGIRLEIERLSKYAKMLGLGRPTGIDLPHESSGLFQDPEWKMRTQKVRWFPAETVSVSIGQAMSLTPVQLARVAAVVANGGRLPRPHLMKSIGGTPVNTDAPVDLGFRPSVVATVRDAMMAVVSEGTGQRAKLDGVAVGGKTGSAQVVTHARLESNKDARAYQPHGWFMAFAPPTNGKPGMAVAVLVEHGVGGGVSAAPVVGKALARYFGVPAIGPGMTPPPDVIPADPQPVRAHARRRRRRASATCRPSLMPVDRRLFFNMDWVLLAAVLILSGIGVANIVSAQPGALSGRSSGLEVKQLYAIALGIVGLMVCVSIDYRRLVDRAALLYFLTLGVLVYVLVWAPRIAGTRRWVLGPGGFQIQPSEFAKLVAASWSRRSSRSPRRTAWACSTSSPRGRRWASWSCSSPPSPTSAPPSRWCRCSWPWPSSPACA